MFFSEGLKAVIKKYTEMQVEDSDGEKLDYFSDRVPVAHRRRKAIVSRNASSCATRGHGKIQRTLFLKNSECFTQKRLERLLPVPLPDHGSSDGSARKRPIIAPIEELEYALARGTTGLSFVRSSNPGYNALKRRKLLSSNLRTLLPMEEFKYKLRVYRKQASSFSLPNGDRMDCGATSSELHTPSTSEEIESPSHFAVDRRLSVFGRRNCERVRGTPNWFNPSSTSSAVDAYREPPPKCPVLSQSNLRKMERLSGRLKDKISSNERILSWILSQRSY